MISRAAARMRSRRSAICRVRSSTGEYPPGRPRRTRRPRTAAILTRSKGGRLVSPRKTLAMVQTGVRKLEPRELPVPEIDADSALLRVEACGICGSDYEQYEGLLRTPVPVIPGHEPLGVIEAIGDRAATR